MTSNWKTLLKGTCGRLSEQNDVIFEKNDNRNVFKRDLDQICFWSSFRRLQDKAQVFPLEDGDFSRTRLTHSIEVMSIAQSLGEALIDLIIYKEFQNFINNLKINTNKQILILQEKLKNCDKKRGHLIKNKIDTLKKNLDKSLKEFTLENYHRWIDLELYTAIKNIPLILQSASLIHDLGNPPFGHISESIISDWFSEHLGEFIFYKGKDSCPMVARKRDYILLGLNDGAKQFSKILSKSMIRDFTHFDGNAELLRIITKLQNLSPDTYGNSVKISYPVLATTIKYPDNFVKQKYALDNKSIDKSKKNYFESEKNLYLDIQKELKLGGNRHPLAFLLEAADDIAYLSSDLEDALTKNLISKEKLITYLKEVASGKYNFVIKDKIIDQTKTYENSKKIKLLIDAIRDYSKDSNSNNANKRICLRIKGFLIARAKEELTDNYELILKGKYYKNLLDGRMSSPVVDIIRGILKSFVYYSSEIVKKKAEGIKAINKLLDVLIPTTVSTYINPNLGKEKDSERFIHKMIISKNFIELCNKRLDGVTDEANILYELIFLVIDFISGMTDSFAISTSKLL